MLKIKIVIIIFTILPLISSSQVVNVGSGSYTTQFPGTDNAGRNGYPSGSPQVSGVALSQPIPTNDWWSYLLKENHVNNLFNYPLTMKTTTSGLVMTYIPFGVIGDQESILIGVEGLNSPKAKVSDHSDWTVTMSWDDNNHNFNATSGIGMPFVYFTKSSNDTARVEVKNGNVTISNETLIVSDAQYGADYAIYAPNGSIWSQSGNVYSSNLNGKNYWSAAMLPQNNTNTNSFASSYKKYAYVFPENTEVSWIYDESDSSLKTQFNVSVSVKEGNNNTILQGLLPHQWYNLSQDSPIPDVDSYESIRGELKMLNGNFFEVENTFLGILPTLPYLANYSNTFSPSELEEKINLIENDGLAEWTDSYNEGQMMNRLIQTARIANKTNDIEALDKIINTIKNRLEDWLTYQSNEVAFLFYYNQDWTTLLGYPAGHGQDSNINDHHFHWGYFIHAAAFIEQFEPGWASEWGDMVNVLIRDAASPNRNDNLFPFLRNFSPYAGHAWANGFATFPQGNDQESTSESMQFNSSLIHWGSVTGNDEIRDLGIYLYTTEKTAIDEYWFDVNDRVFSDSYSYSLASRVWGNSYDSGTFWTADIAAAYGIEMYPIHGGSLYLGHNLDYVQKLWDEMIQNTGILSNEVNPNLWHDVYWSYAAFINPDQAIALYDSFPNRGLKFGISDAQTYYWLHSLKSLGSLKNNITSNHPISAVFENGNEITYVAHNYSDITKEVIFSDGFILSVPARSMATNRDVEVSGVISSNFYQAYNGGSVELTVDVTGLNITHVEFYNNGEVISNDNSSPYFTSADNLSLGNQSFYAKVYTSDGFIVTNSITVTVGEQKAFLGTPTIIPGVLYAGNFDFFEGGLGQNISYYDTTHGNSGLEYGNFRPNEYVDVVNDSEGANVGWIEAGEWLEYTINVGQTGYYQMNFRYATNNSVGGPFFLEVDGMKISLDMSVSYTGGWDQWTSKTYDNIILFEGEQILRLFVENGGFNIGKLEFSFQDDLDFNPLISNTGENIIIVIPESTAQLDGSNSSIPDPENTQINWSQIYGPSTAIISETSSINPIVSNLVEGVYKFQLVLQNESDVSKSSLMIIVQSEDNSTPITSITSPSNNSIFVSGDNIIISASASDLDGEIIKVEFYSNQIKIGEDLSSPYQFTWTNPPIGSHNITTIATDNENASSTSEVVNVIVKEKVFCEFMSDESVEGSFSTGYKITFETIGGNVKITSELFDNDKSGVVGILFRKHPFQESYMDNDGGLVYSKIIGGLTEGEIISYAVKFAFAGGLAVTKYFDYEVGSSCTFSTVRNEQYLPIKIYPNPASGKFNISGPFSKAVIFNIEGKQLIISNSSEIDISLLSNGLYLIKILDNKNNIIDVKRLIIN